MRFTNRFKFRKPQRIRGVRDDRADIEDINYNMDEADSILDNHDTRINIETAVRIADDEAINRRIDDESRIRAQNDVALGRRVDDAEAAHSALEQVVEELEFLQDGTFDPVSGDVVLTRRDNTVITFNTHEAALSKDFFYDPDTRELVFVKFDESEVRVPVEQFVHEYTGSMGDQIQVNIGTGNAIQAILRLGTVSKAHLTSELQGEIDGAGTGTVRFDEEQALDTTQQSRARTNVGITNERMAQWDAGGEGGMKEAPIDGEIYGRQDASWSKIELSDVAIPTLTTTGTSTAFVLTPEPAITEYADGMRFNVRFHLQAGSASPTINISGLGARNIRMAGNANILRAASIRQWSIWTIEFDGEHDSFTLVGAVPDVDTVTTLPATVSQADAEAGTGTATRMWTPQRVRQAAQAANTGVVPRLIVAAESGESVTATNGSTTLTATATGGTATFNLPRPGTWVARAVSSGMQEAVVVEPVREYQVNLRSDVFGVEWTWTNPATALRRLTHSNDPNGYVNANITTSPVAAVGNGAGSSPFDAFMPWMEMAEFNVINNILSHRRGVDAAFARNQNDVVVQIPKFWYKIIFDNETSRMYFYIANAPRPGFKVHEAFDRGDGVVRNNIYVGKYNTGAGYVSRSGLAPMVSITRATARTNSAAKGLPWWQYDYAAWCAIWLLYLVEYADWNSQARIGLGRTGSTLTTVINNGGSDAMLYHTGRAAGTADAVAVQYRGIENLWGNVMDICDGFNVNERRAFICLNPHNFADDTAINYIDTEEILVSTGGSQITSIGYSMNAPFAFLPTGRGGSTTTFVPDTLWTATGWRVLCLSGARGQGGSAGLFTFDADNLSSHTGGGTGTRLMFLP